MKKYCGEIKNVSGTTGGGCLETGQLDPNDPSRNTMNMGMGDAVSTATELPLLEIGNETFPKIRLCVGELAGYIRPGDSLHLHIPSHVAQADHHRRTFGKRSIVVHAIRPDGHRRGLGNRKVQASLRSRDTFWDIRVPKTHSIFDSH